MTTVNTYDVGDVVRVYTSTVFTNIGGSAFDPDVITFKWKDPDGNIEEKVYGTDDEVGRDGTGDYRVDVPLTKQGDWYVRVEGTASGGDLQGADERKIHAANTEFS